MTKKKIYLARHGESVANLQKLISGQSDTPLSEKGLLQAEWLREVLADKNLSAIYTSTLQRTIVTARPTAVYHRLDIQPKAALMEMHFGALQGSKHPHASYAQAIEQISVPTSSPFDEQRENQGDFVNRIKTELDSILANLDGSALIVGHRKTNEILLALLLNVDITAFLSRHINIKNKYVYEIELSDEPRINTLRLGGKFHGQRFAGLKDD